MKNKEFLVVVICLVTGMSYVFAPTVLRPSTFFKVTKSAVKEIGGFQVEFFITISNVGPWTLSFSETSLTAEANYRPARWVSPGEPIASSFSLSPFGVTTGWYYIYYWSVTDSLTSAEISVCGFVTLGIGSFQPRASTPEWFRVTIKIL